VPFCEAVALTVKALKPKDYSDSPGTLAEHLKKRRRELGLLQREVAALMGIAKETYTNWETGKTKPVASQFKPVIDFLGYDPSPEPTSLAERLQARRRSLGITFSEVARHLGWDEGRLCPAEWCR
jgi:transcriptional regulator with XRE-family HTH domain